jgi:hypothetical protein
MFCMKRWYIIIPLLLLFNPVYSQTGDTIRPKPARTLYMVTAGPALAIGEFARTHMPGLTLEGGGFTSLYKNQKSARKHPLLLSWSVAGDYYSGKKEKTAGYSYTYPAYWLVHAYIGGACSIDKDWLVSLAAGPGIGIYNGNTNFNTGLQASIHYAVAKKIFVSPSFKLMKEPGTDWLAAVALRAQFIISK